MNFFEMRVPPVGVFLIGVLLIYLLQSSTYRVDIELSYRILVIGPLALYGAYVALMGVVQFRKAQTTVNPFTPGKSSVLVTSGVYASSRNPMYLGLLCNLIALSVYFATPVTLMVPACFKIYMDHFQIHPEERILNQIFGEEYVAYCATVNRWIGRSRATLTRF